MDPTYGPEATAYREKVHAFLTEKLPSNWVGIGQLSNDEVAAFATEWRAELYEAGYLAPGWPVEYGGAGLSALDPGRGVRRRRRTDSRSERFRRHPHARQHAHRVGHRRAEAALPAEDPVGR